MDLDLLFGLEAQRGDLGRNPANHVAEKHIQCDVLRQLVQDVP